MRSITGANRRCSSSPAACSHCSTCLDLCAGGARYSALRAGLAFLPVTLGIIAGAGLSQQLIRRVGVRAVGLTGMSIGRWTHPPQQNPVAGTYLVTCPGLMIMSVAWADLRSDHPDRDDQRGAEDAGLASGLLNTSQQLGGQLDCGPFDACCQHHIEHRVGPRPRANCAEGVSALVSDSMWLSSSSLPDAVRSVILAATVRRGDVSRIDNANENRLQSSRPSSRSQVDAGCTASPIR